MNHELNSTDRSPGDYVLFALAFIGFQVAAGGVILASAHLAVLGTILSLVPLTIYALSDFRNQ